MDMISPQYKNTYFPKENVTEQKYIYPTMTKEATGLYFMIYNRFGSTLQFQSVNISNLDNLEMMDDISLEVIEKEKELMDKYSAYMVQTILSFDEKLALAFSMDKFRVIDISDPKSMQQINFYETNDFFKFSITF